MICCFHMVSNLYTFFFIKMYFTFKNMKFYFIKCNILYHMKTLRLNAQMEGWWEKDRLRKTTLRLNCIKRILPDAIEPKTSVLKK